MLAPQVVSHGSSCGGNNGGGGDGPALQQSSQLQPKAVSCVHVNDSFRPRHVLDPQVLEHDNGNDGGSEGGSKGGSKGGGGSAGFPLQHPSQLHPNVASSEHSNKACTSRHVPVPHVFAHDAGSEGGGGESGGGEGEGDTTDAMRRREFQTHGRALD